MTHLRTVLVAAGLVAVGISCGGGGTPRKDTGPAPKDVPDTASLADPGPEFEVVGEEGPDGVEASEGVGEEIVEDVPCAGCFGATCTKNEQCQVGFCVDSADSTICTKKCVESGDCPEGLTCKMVANTDIDPIFICIPTGTLLCRPCSSNSECTTGLVITADRCVSQGGQGSFCGVACGGEGDPPCLTGYSCKDVASVDGKISNQCVPDSGQCECSAMAKKLGASTSCFSSTEYGSCKGSRQCNEIGLTDCDARIPAAETCNDVDDNCDGKTDPDGSIGCVTYYQDLDQDGFGMGVGACQCKDPGAGFTKEPGDCNDTNSGAHPGAKEICNGIDDNCNGETDDEGSEGCRWFRRDDDGDGFGKADDKRCLCNPIAPYTSDDPVEDCDDSNDKVFPGAPELCDGLDNDCDQGIDPENSKGCEPWYFDGDQDGFGGKKFKCLCGAKDEYSTQKTGDCDDQDALANPKADEMCNTRDDNCNGKTDEGDDASMCPPNVEKLHGLVACQGKCTVTACDGPILDEVTGVYTPGWYNVNDDFSDGCECQADEGEKKGGETCQQAADLGDFPDTMFKVVVEGSIIPASDEDWFVVHAKDAGAKNEPDGGDHFNLKVQFVTNPGDSSLVVDVYRGSCADKDNTCKGGRVSEWATSLYVPQDGATPSMGEGKCSGQVNAACEVPENDCLAKTKDPNRCRLCPGYAAAGTNLCNDNGTDFFVRVYRDPTKTATCQPYQLEISNGFPLVGM